MISGTPGKTPSLFNLQLPQFPVGIALALVRQAILINKEGKLVPSPLTEMIELRGYHAITLGEGSQYMNYINGPSIRDHDFSEFRISRPERFAGRAGGLVAVRQGEQDYPTFTTHGIDSFDSSRALDEKTDILKRCLGCHSDAGIHAVQSRVRWLDPMRAAPHHPLAPDLARIVSWETDATIAQEQRQPEFIELEKMWSAPPD